MSTLSFFSRESYKLNESGTEIKISISITTAEAVQIRMIKYLTRVGEPPIYPPLQSVKSISTQGWSLFEFWPSTVLSSCRVIIVKAIRVRTQFSQDSKVKKVMDVLWSSKLYAEEDKDSKLDPTVVARKYGERTCVSDGDDVTKYVIQVS